MAVTLDTVLLWALPASGKSEVRSYLAGLNPTQCREEFHMGPTLQLDDYPYVHFMHRIDDELFARRQPYAFYGGPRRPFQDPMTWVVLIELLNEDFADLQARRTHDAPSAAQLLFDRLDAARERAGMPRVLDRLPYWARREAAAALEKEARAHLDELNRTFKEDKQGKTIVIEAARGGAHGATFPLVPPRGYLGSLDALSPEILDRAGILYVWVTPEDSRRKNIERGRPDGQGSILFHSVPMEVMLGEYGCDDMSWLIEQSDQPDTVRVERVVPSGDRYVSKVWHVPVARFDNRADLTTFVRGERKSWKAEDVRRLHDGLAQAFATLARRSAR
jgi:hypothetical protein